MSGRLILIIMLLTRQHDNIFSQDRLNEASDIGTRNNMNILDKADLATSTPSGSLNIAGLGKSGELTK